MAKSMAMMMAGQRRGEKHPGGPQHGMERRSGPDQAIAAGQAGHSNG